VEAAEPRDEGSEWETDHENQNERDDGSEWETDHENENEHDEEAENGSKPVNGKGRGTERSTPKPPQRLYMAPMPKPGQYRCCALDLEPDDAFMAAAAADDEAAQISDEPNVYADPGFDGGWEQTFYSTMDDLSRNARKELKTYFEVGFSPYRTQMNSQLVTPRNYQGEGDMPKTLTDCLIRLHHLVHVWELHIASEEGELLRVADRYSSRNEHRIPIRAAGPQTDDPDLLQGRNSSDYKHLNDIHSNIVHCEALLQLVYTLRCHSQLTMLTTKLDS
jgi:hypothetical protein